MKRSTIRGTKGMILIGVVTALFLVVLAINLIEPIKAEQIDLGAHPAGLSFSDLGLPLAGGSFHPDSVTL